VTSKAGSHPYLAVASPLLPDAWLQNGAGVGMTFEQLYEAHFDFVWTTLQRFGVPAADLPDVVQDVFLTVHRLLSAFEHRSRVTTWLFAICLNAARDRRRRAHLRYEVIDSSVESAEVFSEPGAELERRDDLRLFESGLSAMNLDQRAVFLLFEVESQRGEDIAELLGIPLGTVYSRLRLARQAFRRAVTRAAAQRDGRMLRREGTR
jgi:RNA polymerase sigma-70 factor, ECF subfamily